jgi:hypothetical protein
MPEFELQFATRQVKRTFERAIGKNVVKILTELITNSDDSYRRLEQNAAARGGGGASDPRPIVIVFDRAKRRISVVDQAEGLTDEEMQQRFVMYGQDSTDRSRGLRTRSLFGKGLRDVLFTQRNGQVKSIKNGLLYNCRFKWKDAAGNERPIIDIKPPSRATPEIREALRIPQTGTAVEFVLREDVANPQPDRLVDALSHFYMLRMLNSSPHREGILLVQGRRGAAEERHLSYVFPTWNVEERIEGELSTDLGTKIRIQGEVGVCEEEMTQGEVGYVEREGGILVVDEDDAVLDLWLFGFDHDPAARRMAGIVRLLGAGAYIRAKLNQREPEEILTETRDGFDKQHAFYRQLEAKMRPHLEPIVTRLRKLGPTPQVNLSDKTRKRHQEALDILNRLASEMLGVQAPVPLLPSHKLIPPAQGIAFVNTHVSIRAGISTPAALLVNTSLVQPGASITLESLSPVISILPAELKISEHGPAGGALVKIVRVASDKPGETGLVRATWGTVTAELEVTCTDREVLTPVNGLEFEREAYSVRIKSRRNLRLFVDTEVVPIGTEIVLASERQAVELAASRVSLKQSDLITPKVAAMEIAAAGRGLAKDVLVSASVRAFGAGTRVSVVKREKKEDSRGGLFKDYKFQPLERKVQSQFTPDGYIVVNTKDPVNARYFAEDPGKAVEEKAHCQVRLADLILNECLQIMVSQALQSGKLDTRFPDNLDIDVRNYVEEKKFEIGPAIHEKFVTKA